MQIQSSFKLYLKSRTIFFPRHHFSWGGVLIGYLQNNGQNHRCHLLYSTTATIHVNAGGKATISETKEIGILTLATA